MSEIQARRALEKDIVFFPEGVDLCRVDHLVSGLRTALHLTVIWALPNFPEDHSGGSHKLNVSKTSKKFLSTIALQIM